MVAVVYRLDITKKQISDVFRISDVTISKTYRRIYPFHNIVMNNNITNLVTEKRNQIPRKKTDITKENLVVPKDNFIFQSYEKSDDRNNILLTEDDDIDSSESSNKKIDISDSDSDDDLSVDSYTEDNNQVEIEV